MKCIADRGKAYPHSTISYSVFFFVGMGVQVFLPINGITRFILTALWVIFLSNFAVLHRQKHHWQWQRLSQENLLKSLGTLFIYLWCTVLVIAAAVNGWLYNRIWKPNHPLEAFSEVARALPELMTTTNPFVSLLLVPCVWTIFFTLSSLKILYLSEEEFLKDCRECAVYIDRTSQTPEPIEWQQQKFTFTTFQSYFLSRPLTIQKFSNFIRIEFHKISSQDLQASFPIIGMMLLFFTVSSYGFVQAIVSLPGDVSNMEKPENLPGILFGCGYQLLSFGISSYLIWEHLLRLLFVRLRLDFTANYLIVSELAFGCCRKLFSIDQSALLPLRKQEKQTKVPEVENSILLIQRRGKEIELAGHLLAEDLDTIQQTYETYRASTFNDFYDKIKSR